MAEEQNKEKEELSRRQFISKAGLVAGGALLGVTGTLAAAGKTERWQSPAPQALRDPRVKRVKKATRATRVMRGLPVPPGLMPTSCR